MTLTPQFSRIVSGAQAGEVSVITRHDVPIAAVMFMRQ
jgi:antitoxin (DNA-binding transcriptional repressor) of toxin-antitoxin stability system